MKISKTGLINSIFYPRKSSIAKDEKDHLINVDDKNQVGARFFLKDKSYDSIIFFHGNAELAQEYSDIAELYHNFKLNFIVCDYRGYGLSTGTPTKTNLHSDAIKLFKYINKYLKDNSYNKKLIIMGRSLGSASASEIIHHHEKDVNACIIESGFATEYSLLDMMQINPDDINFSLEDGFMNLKKIKQYQKPLFLIHADLDHIIPFSQAEMMLLESKSLNKDLFTVSGANHNNILMIARLEYFKKIRKFIDSVI